MTPHSKTHWLHASCRVALAAYLHDLGKFAERARLDVPVDVLDAHKTQYCPWHSTTTEGKNGYHSTSMRPTLRWRLTTSSATPPA